MRGGWRLDDIDWTVGLIGAGHVGEALIRGFLQAGLLPPEGIITSDVRETHLAEIRGRHGVRVMTDNRALVQASQVVILCVKPQIMGRVLDDIAGEVDGRHLVISVAAGVSTGSIRRHLPGVERLIRVMPNTPVLIREGMTAIARSEGLREGDLEVARALFGSVGKVVVLEEESMDAVTGLSGSGPGYVALVIESLADGGVNVGLDRETAMTLATQTVLGSARLILETGAHPGELKDMVCSPGGTTIAGITALEEGGVRRTFISAVERATLRSRELGRE